MYDVLLKGEYRRGARVGGSLVSRPTDPLGCERKSICTTTQRDWFDRWTLRVTPPQDKIALGSLWLTFVKIALTVT